MDRRTRRFVVFNPLNWRRSGQVTFDLQDGLGLFDTTTGKNVAYETISVGKSTPLPGFGGGYRRVRFEAENVPGLGYKLFALRPIASDRERADSSETTLDGTTFENSYYRITVDPSSGAVSRIWDKELNRELVDAASVFRFGAYLYVTGADDMPNNSLYRYGATLKPPALSTAVASHGRLLGAKRVPFGTIITMEASAPNTPAIRMEITLYNAKKQIDFVYRLSKEATIKKEAVYIAFPFAADHPEFGYDTQNGWVDPAKDELPGGSHEWYAVQHWAAVRDARIHGRRDSTRCTAGKFWRYRERQLACGIPPAVVHHFLVADDELLGHQLRAATGRRFCLPLQSSKRTRARSR